jgi:RNA polymerase sigma factor (TIGR02999 family)
MSGETRESLTLLLERARNGDARAAARVFPIVYDELRRLAARVAQGRPVEGATLGPTALVHEAFLRLVDRDAPFESRRQFFGAAARAMRSALVDHVRSRGAQKRGGDRTREPFHEALAWYEARSIDVLALDEALGDLEGIDPAKRALVEFRFFAGLSVEDAAAMLGVSRATAEREWAACRAWLRTRLTGAYGPE